MDRRPASYDAALRRATRLRRKAVRRYRALLEVEAELTKATRELARFQRSAA